MIMLKDSVMEDVLKFLDHCEGQQAISDPVLLIFLSLLIAHGHTVLSVVEQPLEQEPICWKEHCHLRSTAREGSVFTHQKVDTDTIDCWQLFHFTLLISIISVWLSSHTTHWYTCRAHTGTHHWSLVEA